MLGLEECIKSDKYYIIQSVSTDLSKEYDSLYYVSGRDPKFLPIICLHNWWVGHSFVIDDISYDSVQEYLYCQQLITGGVEANPDNIYGYIRKNSMNLFRCYYKMKGVYKPDEFKNNYIDLMRKAISAKISQNEDIRNKLLSTKDKVLVYAERKDVLLGVGLPPTSVYCTMVEYWRGKNMLGNILMDIRRCIYECS